MSCTTVDVFEIVERIESDLDQASIPVMVLPYAEGSIDPVTRAVAELERPCVVLDAGRLDASGLAASPELVRAAHAHRAVLVVEGADASPDPQVLDLVWEMALSGTLAGVPVLDADTDVVVAVQDRAALRRVAADDLRFCDAVEVGA